MQFIRTTVLGGIVFLVPVIILIVLLAKAYELMLKIAKPVASYIPMDDFFGVAMVNLVAVVLIFVICFIAGLLAKGSFFKGVANSIDDKLTIILPGYAYIKSITAAFDQDNSKALQPVLVMLDDMGQVAFFVEDVDDTHCVIYFPSAPDPRSGSVSIIEKSRVKFLDASFNEAINGIRRLGVGSAQTVLKAKDA